MFKKRWHLRFQLPWLRSKGNADTPKMDAPSVHEGQVSAIQPHPARNPKGSDSATPGTKTIYALSFQSDFGKCLVVMPGFVSSKLHADLFFEDLKLAEIVECQV